MKLLIVIIGLFLFPVIACPDDVTLEWEPYTERGLSHYKVKQCDLVFGVYRNCSIVKCIPKGETTYDVSVSYDESVVWQVYAVSDDGIQSIPLCFIGPYEDGRPRRLRRVIRHPGGN